MIQVRLNLGVICAREGDDSRQPRRGRMRVQKSAISVIGLVRVFVVVFVLHAP